jgi:hypothetical protein
VGACPAASYISKRVWYRICQVRSSEKRAKI